MCYRIDHDGTGPVRVTAWSDWLEYQRQDKRYFGLRVLITDRSEWSTAEIIQAYRGQAKVEAAFRDLKDAHMLATGHSFTGPIKSCTFTLSPAWWLICSSLCCTGAPDKKPRSTVVHAACSPHWEIYAAAKQST